METDWILRPPIDVVVANFPLAPSDSAFANYNQAETMLSIQQQDQFFSRGYVRIDGAIESDEIARASKWVWQSLEPFGIQQNRPDTWRRPKPKGLQVQSRTALFDSLFKSAARLCLNQLLGEALWEGPKHWGQLLLSLPADEEWMVPSATWHLDIPENIANTALPGVQVFIFLEDVLPKCGATVVAAGSHQLVANRFAQHGVPERGASSEVRKHLAKEYEWFRKLWSKGSSSTRSEYFLEQSHNVEDVQLQVDELVGSRGDMVLMHPYLLHAAAPNIGPALRLALTQRVYVRS